MKSSHLFGPALTTAATLTLLLTSGCGKKPTSTAVPVTAPKAEIAPELMSNALGTLPGAIYRTQAESPIHWQPWDHVTLQRAAAANRLVLAVVAMPNQSNFRTTLQALSATPSVVTTINENYVPILIDGDASREVGLLTADLCAEIKRPVRLPLLVWMTPAGDPVAWIPATTGNSGSLEELFNQSHLMVSRMWKDDADYVMKNSATDNANRRTRIAKRKNANVMSPKPAEDTVRALRQLVSLYDSFTRSFDQTGGLFPSAAIDLLAAGAAQPGLPPETRTRCMETLRNVLTDILPSPMFDPLDGGIFSAKLGPSWSLPSFNRDCIGQAKAAVSLLNAYRATGEEGAREKALASIAFAERNFSTPEGLFALGVSKEHVASAWLWSVEEIEKELSPEDAAWWIKATDMKGLGNLPSEVDPRRELFRCNSLGMRKSIPQIAAELGQTPEAFAPRYEGVRKQLLKVRGTKVGDLPRDNQSHAGASLRMVSTYAAAYAATGDPAFREKAVTLLGKSRAAFADGPHLRMFPQPAPKPISDGRAFLYGLALQAALDVAAISSDEKWALWSEDLATTAAELFTDSDFLKECPDDAKIIDLPVTDLAMLFDDSTAGLVSMAECRLAAQGRPLVPTFSTLATPLPNHAMEAPVLHSDILIATLTREFNVTAIVGSELSPEMTEAVQRLPLRAVQRRKAKPGDQVAPGTVHIIRHGEEPRKADSPKALEDAVLP